MTIKTLNPNEKYTDADSAKEISNTMLGLGNGNLTGIGSSSDWKQMMQPAAFNGIQFPTTQVKGSSGRKLVKHVYPYTSGQDIVDLGRQPLTITMSAVFSSEALFRRAFGDDLYPGRYMQLIATVNDGEAHELIHPVFGKMWARCESYSDTTQATELNTVRLELTFVEANVSKGYVDVNPRGQARDDAVALDKIKKG